MSEPQGPSEWPRFQPPPPPAPGAEGPTGPHRGRRLLALGVAAVLVAGAVVGTVLATSGSSGPSPEHAVVTSAQSSLADKTADVQLSLSVEGSSLGSLAATGSGAIDFSSGASQLQLTYSGLKSLSGDQLTEISTGGTDYVSVPLVAQLLPGKSWISVDDGDASSLTPGVTDPADILGMLEAEGASVDPLGPSTLGGDTVEGYKVSISSSTIDQGVGQSGLPAGLQKAVQGIIGTNGVTLEVYVGTDGLVREIQVPLDLTVGGSPLTAEVTLDFTQYGTPVTIVAPPASEVVSLSQFEQALGSGGGSDS